MSNIIELVISYPDFHMGDMIDPEAFDQNNMEIVTKINEIITELNSHTTLATLDHPNLSVTEAKLADGACTDVKIGSRTVDQAIATAPANTGTLTQLLSWIVKEIKAIKGSVTNWYDSGASTISAIWAKFNASTGHKHTGAANDAPKLIAGDIVFTPSGTITASNVQTAIGKLDGDIVAHKTSDDHDGRYYTETEVDNLLGLKSNVGHTHTPDEVGAIGTLHGISAQTINFVEGTGISIVSNDVNNTITITATTEAVPGYHMHNDEDINLTDLKLSGDNKLDTYLKNYNEYASVWDATAKVYKVVEYRRPEDGTLYLKSTLSNPDVNGYLQTLTLQYYAEDGINVVKTVTWTLSYDSRGKITSKVVN